MNFEPFTFIIEQLNDILFDEFNLLSTNTKKLLKSLQQQLEVAQSFVRDIDECSQQTTTNSELLTEAENVMQIIPEIENFLDLLYKYEVLKSQLARSSFAKIMAHFSCTSNPVILKHNVLKKATQLLEELQAARQVDQRYQPRNLYQRQRPPAPNLPPTNEFIIGLEGDVRYLVAKLCGKDRGHPTILGIVGMGASGKTILARELYCHQDIVRHFTRRAWVYVSQEWDTLQLLRDICLQVGVPIAEDEMSTVVVKLQEFLQRSNYLIVLDDVWKKTALEELLPVLLSEGSSTGGGRGKILVTTRKEDIIKHFTPSGVYVHKVRSLTPDESWELFSKIVSSYWRGIVSFEEEGEFEQLGRVMLEKCDGLPLAIVTLAGLLCSKRTIHEWKTMSHLMQYGTTLMKSLELSYLDLPYDLKPCFLYLGVFHEDSDIDVHDVIQLWIGEGLLQPRLCNECKTLEELAQDFLDELVQRCMVKVVRRDYEGKIECIRVHDLIRDFCMEKAKDLSFFQISSPTMLRSTSMKLKPSRLIIHERESFTISNFRLRSLICFEDYGGATRKLELPSENMKFLRVLHLEKVDLGDTIEQIGNMTTLRYLKIRECIGAKQLPYSIQKLRNLLTFIFDGDLEAENGIPNNMVSRMEGLRHFSLIGKIASSTTLGMDNLLNLQTLRVSAGDWLAKELLVVRTCRVLELEGIYSQPQLEGVYDFVSNPSRHLRKLSLVLKQFSGLEFDLDKLKLESCEPLKYLYLEGKIRKQQLHFLFPPNLVGLDLDNTQIEDEEDLMRALALLGQLRCLKLKWDSYLADKLTMVGLPQLQELYLSNLSNLKEWRIEGELPQLNKLEIFDCDQLERIPERIGCIRTLQIFHATFMSEIFCKRLRRPSEKEDSSEGGGGGEDFHLIQHISSILINDGNQNYA